MNLIKHAVNLFRKDQTLHLLSDQPTVKDTLRTHTIVADTVADIVCSDLEKPFVIGLYGSWGSGKSSILRMLEQDAKDRFRLVVIDAWRKDKDNFLRHFVKKLAQSLLDAGKADLVCQKVDSRRTEQESTWKPDKHANLVFWIFVCVAIFFLAAVGYGWVTGSFWKDFGTLSFTILIAVFFNYFLPRYSRHIGTSWQEVTLEDPAYFRKLYFGDILSHTSEDRICIAIDNLDRVPAEDALKIIRTLKTFIVDDIQDRYKPSGGKVVFLVPCDDKKLADHVDQCGNIDVGKEFLRKFVNVSVRIPSIQYQDLTKYVHELLAEVGVQGSSLVLDNLAFVITCAVGNTPRHPKHFINSFLARYRLALKSPHTARIVQDHPDWLAVYVALENELVGNGVPRTITELRNEITESSHPFNWELYSDTPSRPDFLRRVQGIVELISPEAWHSMRYLKIPNIHDTISGYPELVAVAFDRRVVEFQERIRKIAAEQPNSTSDTLAYLWEERRDNNNRLSLAHVILSAIENGEPLELPRRIVDGLAYLISAGIPGWSSLPPKIVYERVLRQKPADIIKVLGNNSSDRENPNASVFRCQLLKLLIGDDGSVPKPHEEIKKALTELAPRHREIATFAIEHREYAIPQVFTVALQSWRNREEPVKLAYLVEYVKALRNPDSNNYPSPPTNFVRDLFLAVFETGNQGNRNSTLSEDDAEGILAMVTALTKGEFPPNVIDADVLLNSLNTWIERSLGVDGNQTCCLIEAGILLSQPSKLDNINLAVVRQNILSPALLEFTQRASETRLADFLVKHVEFLAKYDQSIIDRAAMRSSRLFNIVLKEFPSRRSTVLNQVVKRNIGLLSAWSQSDAAAIPQTIKSEIAHEIIGIADGQQSDELYQTLGNLGMNADGGTSKRFTEHFDRLIQGISVKSSAADFQSILMHMQMSKFTPTPKQTERIREALNHLPSDAFTNTLKTLITDVMGGR